MRQKRGFTLVELLVVVAIIGLLIAMLLPSLQKARLQALRVQCASNMRQALMGLTMYVGTYKDYPFNMDPSDQPILSVSDPGGGNLYAPYWAGQEGDAAHWAAYLIQYGYAKAQIVGCITELPDANYVRRGGVASFYTNVTTAAKVNQPLPYYYFGPGTDNYRTNDYYTGLHGIGQFARPGRSYRKSHNLAPLLMDPWITYGGVVATFATHNLNRIAYQTNSVPFGQGRYYDFNLGWTDGSVNGFHGVLSQPTPAALGGSYYGPQIGYQWTTR